MNDGMDDSVYSEYNDPEVYEDIADTEYNRENFFAYDDQYDHLVVDENEDEDSLMLDDADPDVVPAQVTVTTEQAPSQLTKSNESYLPHIPQNYSVAFVCFDVEYTDPSRVLGRMIEISIRIVYDFGSFSGGYIEAKGYTQRYNNDGRAIDRYCYETHKISAEDLRNCPKFVDHGKHMIDWLKKKGFNFVDVGFNEAKDLGVNLVSLGNKRVLSMSGSVKLNEKMRALGYEVHAPDMSMFTLGGGGVLAFFSVSAASVLLFLFSAGFSWAMDCSMDPSKPASCRFRSLSRRMAPHG